MKYLITDDSGSIYRVSDTVPTEEELGDYLVYHEISDEDAATIEASEDRLFYIEGSLVDFDAYIQHAKHQRFLVRLDEEHSDANLDKAKKFARDYYAEKRYDLEVSGLDLNGLMVRTDRFTVERIYQANTLATADPTFDTEWKLGDGSFMTVDATLIGQLSDAVTQHIKASFIKEKAANAAIDAATSIADLKAIVW